MAATRADLVLGSPLGRQLLVDSLGSGFSRSLFDGLGLGEVPGTARLARWPARLRRGRSRPSRDWQEVTADEARAVIGAAVSRGEWHEYVQGDELDLLGALAGSVFALRTWTTAAAGDIPATAFGHFIDTLWPFEETGVTVWSLRIAPGANVLEITDPADWQNLVARFPRDVTGTHDGEWRYWGGVSGPWRLPDWELVMDHYDGVHVTVGGFVASCGLALPVGDAYTMLAGWIPGATLWLRDVTVTSRPLGRWRGDPQNIDWDDVRDNWKPRAQ